MSSEDDDYTAFDQAMGMAPTPPATPELGFYNEQTAEGKYKSIENCIYWFKHELCVYMHLDNKGYSVYTLSGVTFKRVPVKDLARALLEYYYLMHYHTRFHGERAKEMNKNVDLQKFLDLVMEYPTIKKIIANPHELV